ncbi:MAG: hypothetical protein ABI183_23850 [Polyangiaceae bacterium]
MTVLAAACSSESSSAPTGATASFDIEADFTSPDHFYDFPYPSDLRLSPTRGPIASGFPNPASNELVTGMLKIVGDRSGFPVIPVAYFQFSAPLPQKNPDDVIAADPTSPILLVDVDPSSSERGKLFPTVAVSMPTDNYTAENVLGVAPRPGIVLIPKRAYAFVVRRELNDQSGALLGVAPTLGNLASGGTPSSAHGAAAKTSFAPLWDTLRQIKIDPADVAAATVFTTGDVVADLSDLSEKLAQKYPTTIQNLTINPNGGAANDRMCEVVGTMSLPQFQAGTPPFDTDGLFVSGSDGLPVVQRMETVPLAITLPKGQAMPADGYPLLLYLHGSGGVSTAAIDRGTWHPTNNQSDCAPNSPLDTWNGVSGCNTPQKGPAYVISPFGLATAASALPVNPERLPGADDTAYLNFNNLAAFRDTFRQGVIEQRIFLDALSKLTIDPAIVASCTGISLPAGAPAYKLDLKNLVAQGQSMGGMYTNLISAVDPRVKASVPTGAGGYWSYFIMKTTLIDGLPGKVSLLVGTPGTQLSFMHPALQVFETGIEWIDPIVFAPRVSKRPLDGSAPRPIYEPVGLGDSYFPTEVYNAMSLAYGHPQLGNSVWPTMQDALSLEGLGGVLPLPQTQNLTSSTNAKYTGGILQYNGDGIYDPHALYSQLDPVKYQIGCFVSTFLKTGQATIEAPQPLGSPCP